MRPEGRRASSGAPMPMLRRIPAMASVDAPALCRRATSAAAHTYDCVIIGAGVIGASCALQLARRGFRTLNLDKGPSAGSGSTSYSSGNLRAMYTALTSTKLANEGYLFWKSWEEQLGGAPARGGADGTVYATFRNCGGLVISSDSSVQFLEACYANHDLLGLPYEVWDRDELARRAPVFDQTAYWPVRRIDDPDFGTPSSTHRIHGAGFFPQAGYVSDPMLAAVNLMDAAKSTGLSSFRFNAGVSAIHTRGGRVSGVTLEGGELIEAPIVLNVGGPHSSYINEMAFADGNAGVANDMRITTRPMRQEVAYVPSMPEWNYGDHGFTVADLDVGVCVVSCPWPCRRPSTAVNSPRGGDRYWRPEVGGKILVGSVEPECDEPFWDYPTDPDALDTSFTEQITNQVWRAALRMPTMPMPTAADGAMGIVAMYDVSDDWLPVYDKSALQGYYMAIGTSGNQFKCNGPAGQLMAALIEYCENGHDHDAQPLQHLLPLSGETIDTSFFSRLRTQSSETSGTVMG